MKKYKYEVGISIQTVYIYPEANNTEEAEELAQEEFSRLSADWEGFDLDYYADSVQIEDITQEYKEILNGWSGAEGYSDGEVLDILFEDTGTQSTADLIKLVKKCCSSISDCNNAHKRKENNE
jgi:hypothetical protein